MRKPIIGCTHATFVKLQTIALRHKKLITKLKTFIEIILKTKLNSMAMTIMPAKPRWSKAYGCPNVYQDY